MFEQRILCHKLPNSFNSITINDNEEQCVNKRNKKVQDLKRKMLNTELEQYELKIQHYEHLYEQELATFQSEIYKTESSYQICHLNQLIYFVKIYIYYGGQLNFPPSVFFRFFCYISFIFQFTIYSKKAQNALHLLVYLD
jgi:hypothetical protein